MTAEFFKAEVANPRWDEVRERLETHIRQTDRFAENIPGTIKLMADHLIAMRLKGIPMPEWDHLFEQP